MSASLSPSQRFAVAAALAAARAPTLLARGLRAVTNGLLLGALSDATLRALDERYYEQTGMYRTAEWNESGLFGWERAVVEGHFEPGGRIVVVGAGGGREVLALLEAGYDAVGYESHPDLAAYGDQLLARHGHPGRIHAIERDAFPDDVRGAGGAIIGWGAYSLIHGRERRVAVLRAAADRLAPGAPIALSFFDQEGETRELALTGAIAGALRRLRGAAPLEPGDTLAPNRVHVFTRPELAAEFAAADLERAEYRIAGTAEGTTRYAAAVARTR